MLRKYLLLFLICGVPAYLKAQLFDQPKAVKLVSHCVDHIYNLEHDSAMVYLDSIKVRLPDHPIVPMLKAVNVLWANIPYVTVDSTFDDFREHLYEVIAFAKQMDGDQQEHPEAIFFEMSARGLLAEYYADADNYMKAINEAGKAYGLLKKGFELTEKINDFYLTTGIYNYFREAYPEKYPIYKPFVWIFRSGDKTLGIDQLEIACKEALLVQVESYIYLAYVYLRYENQPQLAREFLHHLSKEYPNNSYIRAKFLEAYAYEEIYHQINPGDIDKLLEDRRGYYQLAGLCYQGLYQEWVERNDHLAEIKYRQALGVPLEINNHGEFFESMSYLGIGRILARKERKEQAVYNLEKALSLAETAEIKREANKILKTLR